ncbi:MAG: pilus assembly protein FimT [Methylobacter sp.]|nr:MAG: pilus assembly protein FimT [Methylobacter sp.]
MHNRKSLPGFTLVELMVTLAVASILVGIATPSFQTMISNSRLTSTTNDFIGALTFARSEAVKRGIPVTILHRDPTPAVWETGWDIFADANGDNTFNPEVATQCSPNQDCLLRSHEALHPGYTLSSGGVYDERVTFLASGRPDPSLGLGDTFTLCDGTHDSAQSRQIIINFGRARVSVATGNCP